MTTLRTYRARPGARFTDEQAERYGKFLDARARLGGGVVETATIVNLARPENSPIHDAFEWDDSLAAEEYRKVQARKLVEHILVIEDTEDGEVEQRAFLNVRVTNGEPTQGYTAARLVWRDPVLSEQVIARALRELEGWTERYEQFTELAAAASHVRRALATIR